MNGPDHRIVCALTLGTAGVLCARRPEEQPAHVLLGCAGGYCFGTLPDLVGPATNSNHRQFLHRVVIAVAIGYGLYRLYRWDPETPFKQIVRILALLAGGAYFVHLAMDATTRRSLLWVGRLN